MIRSTTTKKKSKSCLVQTLLCLLLIFEYEVNYLVTKKTKCDRLRLKEASKQHILKLIKLLRVYFKEIVKFSSIYYLERSGRGQHVFIFG